MTEIQEKTAAPDIPQKEQIEEIVRLFEARAASRNKSLKLRK